MNGSSRLARAVILAAASTLFYASVANADKPDDKKRKPRQVVDTGVDLLPADATAEAMLERMTSRSSEGLVIVTHPNGMQSMDLDGRFMNVMLATPAADGSAIFSCQTGPQALKAASAAQTVKAWKARATAENAQANAMYLEEK